MARSWQYARWRRIVVQVILWVILGGTMGLAMLVVRHRTLVGPFELANPRTVTLPGGIDVSVRLPKGWPVENDPGEHDGTDDVAFEFRAKEPTALRDEDGNGGDGAERALIIECLPLTAGMPAVDRMDVLMPNGVDIVDERGRPFPVAEVDGIARVGRIRGHGRAYAAIGVVPKGPLSPKPVAVTVLLYVPPGAEDDRGDRELLRRVAAAVSVQPNRATGHRGK